jgi:hypothetical protein
MYKVGDSRSPPECALIGGAMALLALGSPGGAELQMVALIATRKER